MNPGPILSHSATWDGQDIVEKLTIGFRGLRFARPFGAIALAEALRDLLKRRRASGLGYDVLGVTDSQESAVSYLGHVGLFSHIGIEFGKSPGEAPGGGRYLPVTVLSRGAFQDESSKADFHGGIDKKSEVLARMIFEDPSKRDMLSYCLREVIRNVFEHAEVDCCTVMAQKYLDDDVEIVIVDRGIGVLASLSQGQQVSIPAEALRLAVQPGISRVTNAGKGRWANGGFGLYVISQLGTKYGKFRLVSSGSALETVGEGHAISFASFPGT